MIRADYARTMAAYNKWQNDSLSAAAGTLDDAARKQDRGASSVPYMRHEPICCGETECG